MRGGLGGRTYGTKGPWVVLLHGGPGAPGHMAPVARGLEDAFRVLEPFQRGSGNEPLTVARHVADLHAIVEPLGRPALVGSSWGAMLALAYAAAHPKSAGPLVLVGCGTFDLAARARFKATIDERMDHALRARMAEIEGLDPDRRLAAYGDLLAPVYDYDPLPGDQGFEGCDARAHEETWNDMLRLQADGTYPAAFAAIESPVLMLHGAFDPHPGAMIRASLAPHVRRLEYVEWERCGHYPWRERHAREPFFATLRGWLAGPTLPLERLEIQRMASGHASLLLTERVRWESFPGYADALVRLLGGTVDDRADSPVERVLAVTIDGQRFWLAHDDQGASLDARTAAASALLPALRRALEGRRAPP